MKKFFGVILILLALVAVAGVVLGLMGTCKNEYIEPSEDYCSWMEDIKDDALLNQVVIPGSHDAGTASMLWLGETQTYTVKEQLYSGVRYFDLRVNYKDGDLIIFHDIINGVEFTPIIDDIKKFIQTYDTETILLDFQHFKNGSEQYVLNVLKEQLLADDLLVTNSTDLTDLEYINSLTMKDVRGKIIIFWGNRTSTYGDETYLFLRNNDTCEEEGMSLNSYYEGEYHKLDSLALFQNAYPLYYQNIIDKIAEEGKGIFVLQGQLTDGMLILGPWSKEKSHESYMTTYVANLRGDDNLQYINIILRDFITIEKTLPIIQLNYYKGNTTVLFGE